MTLARTLSLHAPDNATPASTLHSSHHTRWLPSDVSSCLGFSLQWLPGPDECIVVQGPCLAPVNMSVVA